MRSLKFRAWVNDHWVDWIPTCKTLGAYNASIIDTDGYTFEEDNPFIVEQYTGLKDKNGKEIYEGDILKFIKDPEMARVVWNTPSAEFHIKWLECGVSDSLSWHLHDHGGAEVIGTIHESPELLEGEK